MEVVGLGGPGRTLPGLESEAMLKDLSHAFFPDPGALVVLAAAAATAQRVLPGWTMCGAAGAALYWAQTVPVGSSW